MAKRESENKTEMVYRRKKRPIALKVAQWKVIVDQHVLDHHARDFYPMCRCSVLQGPAGRFLVVVQYRILSSEEDIGKINKYNVWPTEDVVSCDAELADSIDQLELAIIRATESMSQQIEPTMSKVPANQIRLHWQFVQHSCLCSLPPEVV